MWAPPFRFLAPLFGFRLPLLLNPVDGPAKKPLCSAPKRLQRMLLRLQSSRPNYPIFVVRQQEALFKEFENIDLLCDLSVTDSRLKQIKTETAADASRQCLLKVKSATSLSIREYRLFRDEIIMQDGIVFKAYRVIISKSMRKEMLNRIIHLIKELKCVCEKLRRFCFGPT